MHEKMLQIGLLDSISKSKLYERTDGHQEAMTHIKKSKLNCFLYIHRKLEDAVEVAIMTGLTAELKRRDRLKMSC